MWLRIPARAPPRHAAGVRAAAHVARADGRAETGPGRWLWLAIEDVIAMQVENAGD